MECCRGQAKAGGEGEGRDRPRPHYATVKTPVAAVPIPRPLISYASLAAATEQCVLRTVRAPKPWAEKELHSA
jgi:hypothetical protein